MTDHDYDLSTLTNIRLNNRKAHQRLFADHDNSLELYTQNMTSPHKRIPLSNSYKNRSEFKVFTSSPMKSSKFNDLDKENLRYLDKDYYSNDSKQNDIKRERFLDNIYGSAKRSSKPSPLKQSDTEVFHNLGFRPRNRELKLPDLRLKNQLRYKEESPLKPLSNYKYDYLDNKLDGLGYEKHSQRLQHDDPIDRYKLSEIKDFKFDDNKEARKMNEMISQLEDKVSKYKTTIKELQCQLKQESYAKRDLYNKLNDAEKYSKFLESNFDSLYQKYQRLRAEKNFNLNPKLRPNQDLRFDITDDTFDSFPPVKNDDSTTLNLMTFKARSNSP